jgi:hypothetical protein
VGVFNFRSNEITKSTKVSFYACCSSPTYMAHTGILGEFDNWKVRSREQDNNEQEQRPGATHVAIWREFGIVANE